MKNSEIGSFIAGIGATEDIDSSGEIIEIKGIDHSSLLKDGKVHFEHKNDNSSQVIGKIVDCKKILKESDCEHELHKRYWEKARKRPFMYVVAVLFDKMGHQGAMDALAQAKFDQHLDTDKTNGMSWWSIEGSRLNKEGNRIKKCIARDWAYTHRPCNKSCLAELLTDEQADKFVPHIAKKKVQDSMKKSLEEESDLKKSDRKYMKELAGPKGVKTNPPRYYSKITTATGEERRGQPTTPKRTFTSENAPDKIKVGDRIEYKKPKSKGGAAFYRDLYKELDNPVRKAIMKKSEDLYHIHQGKQRITDKPVSLKEVNEKHGGAKKLESSGYRLVPHKEQKPEMKKNIHQKEEERLKKLNQKAKKEGKQTIEDRTKQAQDFNQIKPKENKKEILKSLANEAWENFKHKDLLIDTIKKKEPELSEAEVIGIAKTFAYMDMKKKESEIEDMFEKNKDGRCWDGYKPTPDKKPYSKGSCQPIKKAKVDEGRSKEAKKFLRQKRRIEGKDVKGVHQEDYSMIGSKGVESEAGNRAYRRGDMHGNKGKQSAKEKHRQISLEQKQIKPNLPKSEDMDKKEDFNFKADHKSDKGGLTEKGRKAYNKATGSNLKRPQPEGGKRKKSFCARNKGQIDMHNIDCKKDPEKRACKARKRWKCNKNEEV